MIFEMLICDLDVGFIEAAARLLVEAFAASGGDAFASFEDALAEVREVMAPRNICRAAVAEDGCLAGWVAAAPRYNGRVWEVHPLAVAPVYQRRGIGRALMSDLEEQAARRGGITLWLGSDDENNRTSLGNADLYPDVLGNLQRIQNRGRHPYEFYQKIGFSLAGCLPDANGFGKPDIFLSKRIGKEVKTNG